MQINNVTHQKNLPAPIVDISTEELEGRHSKELFMIRIEDEHGRIARFLSTPE